MRTVMADSIEQVLERGERIELLVDRAERLEANAVTFAKSSTAMRKSLRWKSIRCYIAGGAAMCGGLWLVLAFSCGGLLLPECLGTAANSEQAALDGFEKVS